MFTKVSRHHRQYTFLTDLLLSLFFYYIMHVCILTVPTPLSRPPISSVISLPPSLPFKPSFTPPVHFPDSFL